MTGNVALSETAVADAAKSGSILPENCGGKLSQISADRDYKILCKVGVKAEISLDTGDQRTVIGVFDSPWIGSDIGTIQTETQAPQFRARIEDLEGVKRNNLITVYDKRLTHNEFKIVSPVEDDGTGMAFLMLRPET